MVYIQLSVAIYAGFKYYIPNDKFNFMTDEEIIMEIKETMKLIFKKNDLYILEEGINSLILHFHREFNIKKEEDIIYLCDHKH